MAEAQRATASLPELSVVLFNVHSNDAVTAKDRQDCLREMLDSVLSAPYPDPLFIFCQEFINGPKHKIVCEKLGQKPKSVRNQSEAGLYYRLDPKGRHEVRYLDASALRKNEDCIGLEPNVPFEVGRLMACVLTMQISGINKNMLLISWHGPETKAKKDVNLKSACFRRLVRFSERLRREESCSIVIIGGDFNLEPKIARQLMDAFRKEDRFIDGAVLDDYKPPADRERLYIRDFIVYWPQQQLRSMDISVIRPDYRREKGSRPFDHPVVGYRFGNLTSETASRPPVKPAPRASVKPAPKTSVKSAPKSSVKPAPKAPGKPAPRAPEE